MVEEYFLSSDNGLNWNRVSDGLSSPVVYSLATDGLDIFAGTGGGIFLSTNNGNNWSCYQ